MRNSKIARIVVSALLSAVLIFLLTACRIQDIGFDIDESEQLPIDGINTLIVDFKSGDIEFVEADAARVELKGKSFSFVDEAPYLKVSESNGNLTAEFDSIMNSIVKMTVYLPKENMFNLKIISTSGNIKIHDMAFENIDILSTSGNSYIDGCSGKNLDIDLTSGNTNVSNVDFKDIQINGTSGNIDVLTTQANLNVEILSGSVDINDVSGSLDIQGSSGRIDVDLANKDIKPINIRLSSGDVRLTLDAETKFNLDAQASSGNVATDFEVTIKGNSTSDDNSIVGKCNGGGSLVKLQVTSGDINVLEK
ncbi:MAG: DUF4097 family beta strand repeat protein [Clostridia bacterium]|mgnify:CR=1 FL=1|jgi:lia operon protein LiaG|nr:DUF4097 family beta strand repeat protein [Clostridia bacterium]